MSARMWKLATVGLGALTLSCSGVSLSSISTGNSTLDQGLAVASSTAEKLSDCEKLREKVSYEEERALGGAVALKWVTGGDGLLLSSKRATKPPFPAEEALQEYINTVGRNLAAQSSRPTLPWTFGVLKEPASFNATSAPGGYVFVTRGLLKQVDNEAQLAGVLAHEIAHVTLQHALMRYDDVKVSQCKVLTGVDSARQLGPDVTPEWADVYVSTLQGSGALNLDGHVDLLGHLTEKVVERIVTNGYAKEDEFAADEVAVRLLLSAGYDPREYIRLLGKLPEGGSGFSHHPKNAVRQARLNKLLAAASQKEGEFSELPATDSLARPALPASFAIARSGP